MTCQELIIPLLSAITIVALATLISYVYYKLKSRKMYLIEKGLWKSEYEKGIHEPTTFGGLLLIAIGMAIVVGVFSTEKNEMCIKTIAGLLPLFVGFALVMYYYFFEKSNRGETLERKV